MFIEVALPLPLFTTFTYSVPDHLQSLAQPGSRVIVPFKHQRHLGVITGRTEGPLPSFPIKSIACILDRTPALAGEILSLGLWMAEYYMVPVGQALLATLPGSLTRLEEPYYKPTVKGTARRYEKGTLTGELTGSLLSRGRLTLSEVQERPGWYERIEALVSSGEVKGFLPEGKHVAVRRLFSLPGKSLEILLEKCKRSPRQKEVLRLLAEENRPLTEDEITAWTPCSSSTIQAMIRAGLLRVSDQQIDLDLTSHALPDWEGPPLHPLTPDQEEAAGKIRESIRAESFSTFLLQGITSSGKTEIYLHAIADAVEQGRTALYLVPEIALTLAPARRLKALFGSRLAILHSGLNDRERTQEYEKIRKGDIQVVIGPRSAVFAPLQRPALIIVDEEQDAAYKQENAPRYHARDLSIVRARESKGVVILGSATPSLVSRHNADLERYSLVRLNRRIGEATLPAVTITDLRNEPPDPEEHGLVIFSTPLREAMEQTFSAGKQAMLLVTRKGYAPYLMCRLCGMTFPCPACSVNHTVHRRWKVLLCHYCNHRMPIPESCPECGQELLETVGIGTEKVEEKLRQIFPGVRSAVVDRDSMAKRGKLKETLHLFSLGRIQCLIGTQMIAKGHDFPSVTLVGVLTVDQMLNLPDFRAAEHVFTLLTQVSGRAGRGKDPGHVIIQTSFPEHYAVKHAVSQDFDAFYEREIRLRRALKYPPFSHMILLQISATSMKRAELTARDLSVRLRAHSHSGRVIMMGPAPAPLARLRGKHRFQILLRAEHRGVLRAVTRAALGDSLSSNITVDIDPYTFL
ncbi:MAG TPA: primosomal protein N' [Thermoanaerobaculia bacterium]|nr:primosomal protein N' [Thermoanaerobaculia bacterium]HUM31270.1 primosomal protein N' [Thermoanaerobaculia bacterium]HXK69603.1 primosomal protein N' [Thermoanaerobaculia bacterium]